MRTEKQNSPAKQIRSQARGHSEFFPKELISHRWTKMTYFSSDKHHAFAAQRKDQTRVTQRGTTDTLGHVILHLGNIEGHLAASLASAL